MIKKTERIPFDIWIITLDETDTWGLPPEDMDKCLRIEGVYLFDKNTITHCCSLSGSYYLLNLENRAIFKENVSYDDQDRINELIMEVSRQDHYYSVYDIDRILESLKSKNESYTFYHYGDEDESKLEETDRNDILEVIAQGCMENCLI